ncbi:TauD/TfdA family dioxygenase [Streptomyces deccanensis]|uniref:TauD/TfdA family dioxygenase n=1 Tax=Streptomyces deccanensis TaxID=424188 RepID=UPI001EFBCE05|nr:TauD/TfdA family dioxygenase [Streptomyces deccanensis]ULR54219.1 TauD/TfdA family dioxygenase [Streptomyces deccanensis]
MSFLSRRRGGARRGRKDTAPTPPPAALAVPNIELPDIELSTDKPPLVTVSPAEPVAHWAAAHRGALRAAVAEHGSLLVRGLGLRDPAEVGAVFHEVADTLTTEQEAFAPRRTYTDGVHSSTAWPPNQPMCMHHESSYALDFPGLLLFACLEAAERGGATGIADAEAVLAALPTELTERFEREGWLLTRSYNDEIGASVAEAFGTADRTVVEAYCRAHSIEFDWRPDGSLHTRQRRAAVRRHPVTGRRCWFNQIAFLNEWTMDPEVRDYLVDLYGADGLPFNTRYGDGDPIGPDVVATLNEVYETHTVRTPWRPGDLLLVDNVRCAHSREPYEGPREVLVGLADPVRQTGHDAPGRHTKDRDTHVSDAKDEVSFR